MNHFDFAHPVAFGVQALKLNGIAVPKLFTVVQKARIHIKQLHVLTGMRSSSGCKIHKKEWF
jgi:hypothetical protein